MSKKVTNIAIICEYNPFHNGHLLQVKKIKERFGENSRIIALMSGNAVQRGELAILPKHQRARAAIACGVDLVLSLPAPYCFGSAEYFASGAIKLLDRLGGIDFLCFGSECGDINELERTADNLSSPLFTEKMKTADSTLSHQKNSEKIYSELFGGFYPKYANDILSVEYLMAIKKSGSTIKPFTYKREEGYSATASRRALRLGESCDELIPAEAARILDKEDITRPELYSAIALNTVRTLSEKELSSFFGMNGGVAGLLKNRANEVRDAEELISCCTCAKYSSARLRRAILCALLGVSESEMRSNPCYSELLAAKKSGLEFLSAIKKTTGIPVITKMSDSSKLDKISKEAYLLNQRLDTLFATSRASTPSELIRCYAFIEKTAVGESEE